MDKGKNIEDIFRKAAENYKVKPGKHVWENVEKEMWNKNFFNNLNEILKKYQVQPSVHVWSNIQSKLKFLMFFRFSWNSFNIYYASFILIAVSGMFMFSDFGSNELNPSRMYGISENQTPANEVISSRETSEDITIADNYSAGENTPVSTLPDKKTDYIAGNSSSLNKNSQTVNDNPNPVVSNVTADRDIILTENTDQNNTVSETKARAVFQESFVKRSGKTADDSKLVDFDKILSSKIRVANSIPIKNNDVVADVSIKQLPSNNNGVTVNPVSENTVIKTDEETPVVTQSQNNETNDPAVSQNNETAVKVAENIASIAIPVDEMYKDTVGKDAAGNDIIIETTHWSADVFWSPMRSFNRYTAAGEESQRYAGLLDNSDVPEINMMSFGIHANYSFKQLLIQTGLSYTQAECSNSVTINTQTFNPYTTEAVFPTTDYTVHEYTFLDLDSLIAGVDYPITVYDTIWTNSTDTFQYVAYDTVSGVAKLNSLARYSWIEIPVIVGFEFERPKYTVTPKIGLIAGYLKGYSGTTISRFDNSRLMDVSAGMPVNKINLSAYFAIGFAYKISGRFEAIADPYLRYNLNSLFSKESIVSQKLYGAGIKLGLRYYFNE